MKEAIMDERRSRTVEPELGVPAARNARIYAVVGLVITAVVGLFVWDMLGVLLGLPFAVMGLVQGGRTLVRTRTYPRDRRAAVTAIVVGLVYCALLIPIAIRAERSGNEPVDCGTDRACLEEQRRER